MLYQAYTFQGTATLFTTNQKPVMTVRSYGNCSDLYPPYTVLPIDWNKKLNTAKNNQSSLLRSLGKGTFRTHFIMFQAGFGRICYGLVCLLFYDFVWSAFWDPSVMICRMVNRKCLEDSVALWTATEKNYTNLKRKRKKKKKEKLVQLPNWPTNILLRSIQHATLYKFSLLLYVKA